MDPKTGEPDENGFDEEYPMEDFDLTAADFMAKVVVPDFRSAWEQVRALLFFVRVLQYGSTLCLFF